MQARILSFLDMPSLVRLGSVSHGLAAATNEDGLWREVLQHQFDVRGQHADCKALVKNLHCGVACGWEGMCLDSSTALWLPIPLLVSGTEVATDIGELDVPSDALLVPDGMDVKTATYRLVESTPEQVVVETVVVEQDFLSLIESAPTRIIYPAKVKRAHAEAIRQLTGAKKSEGPCRVLGKEVTCKKVAGKITRGEAQTEYQLWSLATVPGGIVKQMRTTTDPRGTVTTTVEVLSYRAQ